MVHERHNIYVMMANGSVLTVGDGELDPFGSGGGPLWTMDVLAVVIVVPAPQRGDAQALITLRRSTGRRELSGRMLSTSTGEPWR